MVVYIAMQKAKPWDVANEFIHYLNVIRKNDVMQRYVMIRAFATGIVTHGIKNISALVALPLFNISKGVVVEAMHAVFLGVVKQLTKLLLTGTKAPYYIGAPKNMNLIDQSLLSIKPPSCRSRKPRSISTYPNWKASEWRNWLDYAPVCLLDVLPKKYVTHLALLSEAIHHLNSDCLTPTNLERSDILLKKFVSLFQKYYGETNMSSNIHLMTHLVSVVKNWGPIWAHEAFVFESWNKKIMDFISSSHARVNQIAMRFTMRKFIIMSLYDDAVSTETKKLIAKQVKVSLESNNVDTKDRLKGVGKRITRLPTDSERVALIKFGYEPMNLECFEKMTLNGIKYECQNNKNCKFDNSIIFDGNNVFGTITSIVKFCHRNQTIRGIFILRMQQVNCILGTKHIHEVTTTLNDLMFIEESQFIKPAIQIATSNQLYVIKQTNCWETD
ncbi:GSCOCG00011788001-RA-CDS [Cotesia congregata]|nr:GSCOCG00011788001-RA-CDS [Cotesia congregata]